MGERKRRIGMGLVGPGFVAAHHLDAVRRLGDVDVIAIAGSSQAATDRKAADLHVDKAYGSYQDLIDNPDIEVVHNTTPNYLHLDVSMAAIKAGKHVISDKPLAMTYAECSMLRDAAQAAGVVNVVTFNYRGNPLVQHARRMAAENDIGQLFFLHGRYLQDWMADDHVYSWRLDKTKGGSSSALADIGSHWCDLAQHISGLKIVAVLAEMTTVVKTRYAPAVPREAFSGKDGKVMDPVEIGSEDLASVLLRFNSGATGCLSVGQITPGHKNDLEIELNGRTGSLRWNQENQNELWIGRYDRPNSVMARDPSQLPDGARRYAQLPAGHNEGWSDAFRNVIDDAYSWIRAEGDTDARPATICTFADACQICAVVEAMLLSHQAGGVWQMVVDEASPSLKIRSTVPENGLLSEYVATKAGS
jgi:predicted dehydrogenase